jgi:hypothetical protein
VKQKTGRPPKTAAAEKKEAQSGFAPNQDVLADLLGVDRRTLTNARQRFGDDAPKKRADGRYPILEYKAWLDRCGIRGRGANNPDVNDMDARELDLAERRLRLRKAEFELNKAEQSMLPVAQFERALAKMLAAFLQQLNAFGPRINENLEGLDFDERADVIDREVELMRKTLASCDYLAVEEEEDNG